MEDLEKGQISILCTMCNNFIKNLDIPLVNVQNKDISILSITDGRER